MRKAITCSLLTMVLLSAAPATAETPSGGFWCWTHPDGDSALCGRKRDECEASREGFNSVARSLHEKEIEAECAWQKTAWELVTKRPRGPGHHYPTKKLCNGAMAKGDLCRLAR